MGKYPGLQTWMLLFMLASANKNILIINPVTLLNNNDVIDRAPVQCGFLPLTSGLLGWIPASL